MPEELTNEAFANLSGERGDDVHFEWMSAWIKQYIASKMGMITFMPAEGVAVISGNNPLIFVP